MKTACRLNSPIDAPVKYIIKNIDGRKKTFNAMWITRGGKLAGAKFQRCPRNKHIATLIDGPYYLRVLPVRKYTKGVKENVTIPPPLEVRSPVVLDTKQDGTVEVAIESDSSFILKMSAKKRELKADV